MLLLLLQLLLLLKLLLLELQQLLVQLLLLVELRCHCVVEVPLQGRGLGATASAKGWVQMLPAVKVQRLRLLLLVVVLQQVRLVGRQGLWHRGSGPRAGVGPCTVLGCCWCLRMGGWRPQRGRVPLRMLDLAACIPVVRLHLQLRRRGRRLRLQGDVKEGGLGRLWQVGPPMIASGRGRDVAVLR